MTLTDLELLSSKAAELHERLAVLKYKAYDELVKKEDVDIENLSPSVKISVPENQINLIDVIAEEENKEEPVKQVKSTGQFSFSMEDAEPEVEELAESPKPSPAPATEPEPTPQAKPAPKAATAPALSTPEEEEETSELPGSIAEKLGKSPIADLKKSIGLNQKFQFISDLFKGDNEGYDLFVNQVNSAEGLNPAMEIFDKKKSELKWNEEDKTFVQMLDLVERRHL